MFKKIIRYLSYLKPVKWIFLAAILSGGIAAAASAAGIPGIIKVVFPIISGEKEAPLWLTDFIDQFANPENRRQIMLVTVCLLLPFVFVIRGIATFINGVLVNYVGMRVLELIRMDVFDKLQTLPISFHEKKQKGDLISRMLTDTQNVQTGIIQVANDLIKQPLTVLCAVGAAFFMLWETNQMSLLLINFGLVGLILWPIYYFGKKVTQKSRLAQTRLGTMTAVAQENLASQREIRSYALEDYQEDLFRIESDKYIVSQIKAVKYRQLLMPTVEFVTAAGLAYILIVGYHAGLEVGDFTALAGAIFFAFDGLKKTGVAYNRLKQSQASMERLEEILREPDTMPDPANPVEPDKISGEVRFDHVSFRYDDTSEALTDINVHIPAGQVVGLVGPSGAGKTTFASLIPRFYDVTSGAVLIDDIDVRNMRKNRLRTFISLVSQHAVLFRNTIMENIRLGRRGATDEEALSAAGDANVLPFASIQPQGINTMLGEAGDGLSGGQRQRVALARAFLKDAPILILDEATASLDSDSENLIQEALQKLSSGRTTFIIAHRFNTIRHADRILVFQSGRIIGDGTHDELYADVPLYKELYDKQGI